MATAMTYPKCGAEMNHQADKLVYPVSREEAARMTETRDGIIAEIFEDVRVVLTGAGAAGAATAHTLVAAGAGEVVSCDRGGTLYAGRPGLEVVKSALADETNPGRLRGSADAALAGADVYVGLSGPAAVSVDGIRSMAADRIVFAMANATPEIAPEEIEHLVAVIGTGRSDYPNQINNVLAFPSVFRGALDVRASAITAEMELAAPHALAAVVEPDHMEADYVSPSFFDRRVAPAVAEAVARAAETGGVARRRPAAATARSGHPRDAVPKAPWLAVPRARGRGQHGAIGA